MSFVFPVRSTARPKVVRAMSSTHSRSPTTTSLPAISEDGASFLEPRFVPPVPPRSANRPAPKAQVIGQPPRHNYEKSPPPYNGFDPVGVTGPNGEKLADIRKDITRDIKNNKFVAKRGGWRRLAIFAVVLIVIAIGLGVGLGVGLHNRNSRSSSNNSNGNTGGGASGTVPGSNNPSSNTSFPVGSYRFDTFFSTISTNCTSNAATWMCYPYTTYSQSPSSSAATFDWVISNSSSGSNYSISSTDNVFSILFTNVSLTLKNAGQADEHYFFSTTMQKPTKPASQLGSQNVASTCYFNQTTFQGYLYTKMNATYGGSANASDKSSPFAPWPHAVRVEQTANAAANSPTCLGPQGQNLGDFSVSDTSQQCECLYLNTGT